ncbi:hypothetical protein KFE25_010198 [Diacronema lutheri]|uniref:Protein YIF1 n=2 Tax=Diacronema lutheri TaxID=2081491 RepID=A0A8J5XSW4_DIALT|nr:hypothetical protein KFE25_010198 [Diacronema lutheri]
MFDQQPGGWGADGNGGWGSQPGPPTTNGSWEQAPHGGGYAQPAYGQPAYGQQRGGGYGADACGDAGWGSAMPPPDQRGAYAHASAQPNASYGAPPVAINAAAMAGMAGMAGMGGGLGGGMNGVAQGVAANIAINYGEEIAGKLHNNINRALPIESLRYYFQLNNAFVMSKLKVLLLPFRHRTWARAQTGSGGFAEPRHDINAPDLYLPTMSFVTYVLLIAYHLGQQGRFSPEVFGLTASRGLGVVLLEVVLMKAAFYFFPSPAVSSGGALLDLVAYSGYKFVGVVLSSLIGLFAPPLLARAVALYVAVCTGYFVLKALTEVRGSTTLTPEVMKQNYCIFALAGMQFVFAWYLAPT